jgi:hypothetical protein
MDTKNRPDLSVICQKCGESLGKHSYNGSFCPEPNFEKFSQDSTFTAV